MKKEPQKMARKPPAVEAFGPELMATLLSGAIKVIHIKMPYRNAVRFRMRIYQLRNAMRHEGHPEAKNAQRIFVRILWGEGARLFSEDPSFKNDPEILISSKGVERPRHLNAPCLVVVGPQDSDYIDALRTAGIEVSVDPAKDPLAGL